MSISPIIVALGVSSALIVASIAVYQSINNVDASTTNNITISSEQECDAECIKEYEKKRREEANEALKDLSPKPQPKDGKSNNE